MAGTIEAMPLWKLQTVGGEQDEFLYAQAEFDSGTRRLVAEPPPPDYPPA